MTFAGTYEAWYDQPGVLTSTLTMHKCPLCTEGLWRDEKVVSDEYSSKHTMAWVCRGCKKVLVERKQFVEP